MHVHDMWSIIEDISRLNRKESDEKIAFAICSEYTYHTTMKTYYDTIKKKNEYVHELEINR